VALHYEEVAGRFYAVQCRLQGVAPSERASAKDLINFEAADIANFVMFPVYILLASFKNVLTDNHIPVSKPGFFSSYDPNSDRSKKSVREHFEEDKIILVEIMSGVCWLTAITPDIPAKDNFTRTARVMRKDGIIELRSVLAARMFVDINNILRGAVGRGLLELQTYAKGSN
jgi:hypothetical protein